MIVGDAKVALVLCYFKSSTHHDFAAALRDYTAATFQSGNRRQIMGTLMISIIFALCVNEGIKYLRQIRREMYDL